MLAVGDSGRRAVDPHGRRHRAVGSVQNETDGRGSRRLIRRGFALTEIQECLPQRFPKLQRYKVQKGGSDQVVGIGAQDSHRARSGKEKESIQTELGPEIDPRLPNVVGNVQGAARSDQFFPS